MEERASEPLTTTSKSDVIHVKRTVLIIVVLAIVGIIIFMLSQINIEMINFYLKFHSLASDRINYIAFHEIKNETNKTLLINNILRWEKENLVDMNLPENALYPCYIRIPHTITPDTNLLLQDAYWISVTRCGWCGEFSRLFSELANRLGIENRVITAVHIDGNNHGWVEVINGNETIPVETGDINGFNASKFYSCKWLINYTSIQTDSGKDLRKDYYSRCS